jgi:hypothetical protein
MTFSPAEVALYACGFSLLGVTAGWLFTHWLTISRDRRSRRGAFVGYLFQWRSTISRCGPRDQHETWKAYLAGVHTFNLELGRIREDYFSDKDFMSETDKLGNLQPEDIYKDAGDVREAPCTLIDKLAEKIK